MPREIMNMLMLYKNNILTKRDNKYEIGLKTVLAPNTSRSLQTSLANNDNNSELRGA
jgi:hypothetical protein